MAQESNFGKQATVALSKLKETTPGGYTSFRYSLVSPLFPISHRLSKYFFISLMFVRSSMFHSSCGFLLNVVGYSLLDDINVFISTYGDQCPCKRRSLRFTGTNTQQLMLQIDSKQILIPYILIGRTADLPLAKDQVSDHLLVISLCIEADIGVFYKCMDTDWHWCTNVHPLVGLDSGWCAWNQNWIYYWWNYFTFFYFYRQERQTLQNNFFTFFDN